MRYACIRRHEGQFTIVLMCRVLEVTRTGYYAWRRRAPSARAQRDSELRVRIRAIHTQTCGRYGRPRIHRALRNQQIPCSPKRVARLMRLEGLRGKRARRYRVTTQADGTPPAPNRLQRRFQLTRPNQVWASDVTACGTQEGWLYVAAVLDVGSRRVIGWAAKPTCGQELTQAALQQALWVRRPAAGLVHHSDRGMHYTGTQYQRLLAAHGITVSMSRRGNCWDNAVLESFFATLKTELIAETTWRSHSDLLQALRRYVSWYNRERLHSTLNYQTPLAYERQLNAA